MKQPIRWGVFTALGAMVLAGHAAPARAAGQAQLVMIILDDTGSMTTTGMAGVTGVIRWDDAVMGAINWVMTDETDFTTPRKYPNFTFRNDTVIGGAQNGLKQIYPSATEVGNCNPLTPFDSTTNACIMSTSTSKFGASYRRSSPRCRTSRTTRVTGPSSVPTRRSLTASAMRSRRSSRSRGAASGTSPSNPTAARTAASVSAPVRSRIRLPYPQPPPMFRRGA